MKHPVATPILLALAALSAVGIGLLLGRWADVSGRGGGRAVRLRTEPAGAVVYIDGVYRGRGPLSLHVGGGAHRLRVSAEGYLTHHEAWTPAKEEYLVTLAKRPAAGLRVRSEPPGATVVVDGTVRGRTPLEVASLDPGPTSVTLLLTNHDPETRPVRLEDGEMAELDVVLQHRKVRLYRDLIEADPLNIQLHNDLVRQLFVLGRDREAARAILDGLVILGDERLRRRHPEDTQKAFKEFQTIHRQRQGRIAKALDEEVAQALAEDRISVDAVRAYVENRGPWKDPERLERVLAAAFVNGRYAQTAPLIDAMAHTGDRGALLAAIDRLLEEPSLEAESGLHVLNTLRAFADRLGGGRDAEEIRHRFGALLERTAAGEVPDGMQVDLLLARFWYGAASPAVESDEELFEEIRTAIDEAESPLKRQEYRLVLAEICLQREEFAKARSLALSVMQDSQYRSRSNRQKARTILEHLRRRMAGE